MNTQNREPNIRFNQFKELWKVVKLDSISKKVKSKNLNNTFENVLTNSAEFGIIPQRDFFDKDIANLKSLNGYYVVQPNDFVYNPRISNKAPVGPIKANFLNTTGVMSPLYYVFRTQNIDVFFLAKYFDSSYWHKFMKLNGDTGARSDRFAIKDSVFKEMPIPFPSHCEQSAIGSLFRTLDDLLSSYKDNLTNYQSLKATMLSKMFPKAGYTVPEIRLDGFEGEWEINKLNKYLTVSKKKNTKQQFGKEDVLSVSGEVGIVNQIQFQGRSFAGVSVEMYSIVETGNIVYTKSPLKANPYGIIKTNYGIPGIVSTLYAVYLPNENVFPGFVERYFENDLRLNSYLKPLVNKGAKNDMKVSDENALLGNVIFPKLEEQRAISDYFTNLDKFIQSHKDKISQLETLKKKLLQDMFI